MLKSSHKELKSMLHFLDRIAGSHICMILSHMLVILEITFFRLFVSIMAITETNVTTT